MPRQKIDPVELASSESFPASDPPSWTGVRAGCPPQDCLDTNGEPAVQAESGSAIRVTISLRGRKRR